MNKPRGNPVTEADAGGRSEVVPQPSQPMPYSVRTLDLEKDRDDVLNIWGKSVSSVPETKYSWMYESNPYGVAAGWLLLYNEREVAGLVTLFPRGMLIDGKYRLGAVVGDFVINKQHRTLGPALMLQKTVVAARKSHHFDLIYGFPNEQAALVLQRTGYKLVGRAVRMTKPIRSYYYLSRKLSSEWLSRALAGPIDLVMRWTSRERRQKGQTGLAFEVISDFGVRFDDLWSRISCQGTIVGERSSTYLHWRYACCPYKTYNTYVVTERSSGAILGYVVSYPVGTSTHIADLCAVEKPGVLDCLLSEFLRLQRKKKVDSVSISYFGREAFVEKLGEYGFTIRGEEENVFVLADSDAPWFTQLFKQESWYLFDGDADT